MTELQLYEQVAQYLNLKYPHVVYHFDLSGLWTPSHKLRNLYGRLNARAWPDLFIAQSDSRGNNGLFLELKKEGSKVYLKDGETLIANLHVREQAAMLISLERLGYAASFAVGYDETISLIDWYLA